MDRTICLYFQVHRPLRLRTYRFFDMGRSHDYLDDAANRAAMQRAAADCYVPANALLLRLLERYEGRFRLSMGLSGPAVEQMRAYAPDALEGFRALARTGCAEFVAQPYPYSLSSLASPEEFAAEVRRHCELVESEFGQRPAAFCNTEMIYSDGIGAAVADMGFRTMLVEGAKHVLGWKSPDYVYAAAGDPRLRLLARNWKLSDDIALRFSSRGWDRWPLTAEKFASWLADESLPGELVCLFMDYETFGIGHGLQSGIFGFLDRLPEAALATGRLGFGTASEAAAAHRPVGILHSPHPMSWADEERDITPWLGNELQREAFGKLYVLREKVAQLADAGFDYAWSFLKESDNFRYMATKWLSDGDARPAPNPYASSYEAFINYMNVLSDFGIELDRRLDGRGQPCGAAVE